MPSLLEKNARPSVLSQGFYSSLELLPLYSGVDPDVEIFASGCVQEDGGDWSGGVPLNDVPASDASAPAAGTNLSSQR